MCLSERSQAHGVFEYIFGFCILSREKTEEITFIGDQRMLVRKATFHLTYILEKDNEQNSL